MFDIVEEYGAKLTAVAFLYAALSMAVTYAFAAVGLQPPPLAPPEIIDTYLAAADAWRQLSGAVMSGNMMLIVFSIGNLIYSALRVLFGLVGEVAVGYVWLALLASRSLPPPYNVLSAMVWPLAVVANTLVLIYLLRRLMDLISWLRGLLPA